MKDFFNTKRKLLLTALLFLAAVLCAFAAGWYASGLGHQPAQSGQEFRLGSGTYTNPLLECDIAQDSISVQTEDFTPELKSFIDAIKNERSEVTEAAVYYRDLNNGPVIGVGQGIEFIPASLLKVPIMMVYFHRAEMEPKFLETSVTYSSRSDFVPSSTVFALPISLEVGKSYTYAELIEHMIRYSDNEAMALLWQHVPLSEQVNLYKLVGVNSDVLANPTASLTVKQYSIFFRILFNASYLSQEYSERALKLLAETSFDQGLRAGVPAAISIAHKFGERELDGGLKQLHDCGIVYYPKHPYLLCVMTRGTSMDALQAALHDISRFIYEHVDRAYSAKGS